MKYLSHSFGARDELESRRTYRRMWAGALRAEPRRAPAQLVSDHPLAMAPSALLLLQLACTSSDVPAGPADAFEGVAEAVADGEDGLRVGWEMPTGDVDVFRIEATSVTTGELTTQTADNSPVSMSGLPTGEYDVRVVAQVGGEELGGGVTLRQLVGLDRFLQVAQLTQGCGEITALGSVIAAAGLGTPHQIGLIDVSDPATPVVVGSADGFGDSIFHVALGDDLMFGAAHVPLGTAEVDPVGVRIFDISTPSEPLLLAELTEPPNAHHVEYTPDTLWITVSGQEKDVWVYDVSVAAQPRLLGTWQPPGGAPDEMAVGQDRVWVAWQEGISELQRQGDSIVEVRSWLSPGRSIHSLAPLSSGDYLVSSAEMADGGIDVWDLRADPPVFASTLLQSLPALGGVNMVERDGFLFLNVFEYGIYAFDLTDPASPQGPYAHTWGTERASDVALVGDLLAVSVYPGPATLRFYPPDGIGVPQW